MDLRYPIALLFVVLGVILAVFGLMTGDDTAMYQRSAGVNINLAWGVVMIAFGAIMYGLAALARRRQSA
jgi:hypothetical protein